MTDILAGNNEIKETLKSIVASGRFPHAFILEGERGSGRKTLARIIAAAALCGEAAAPCGHCRECELVFKDGHCDVLTYKPDGATFKIDTVREIRDSAYIMPIEGKRKVNILLDCDKMNEPAQNAFLKILEEPPEFMVFILICTNASSLLTTVRSRCVTLTLTNPSEREAVEVIKGKLGGETVDEDGIREVLNSTHGNIGQAIELLSGSTADAANAAKMYIAALKERDRLKSIKALKNLEKDRTGFTIFLSELRRAAAEEAKKCAVGRGELHVHVAAKLLKTAEETEYLFRRHVGQPLSITLAATTMTAEIFAGMQQ